MDIELKVYAPETTKAVELEVGTDWSLEEVIEELAYLNKIPLSATSYDAYNGEGKILDLSLNLASNRLKDGSEVYLVLVGLQPDIQHNTIEEPEEMGEDESKEEDPIEGFEPQSFHQLGILLLDGSYSMSESGKGSESLASQVDKAVREFLEEFKQGGIVENFSIAVVTFDTEVTLHTAPTKLAEINANVSYNPLTHHGGGTDIGKALEKGEALALEHLSSDEGGLEKDVVIIVMSDGLCQNKKTLTIANRIKENSNIVVATTFFHGRKGEEDREIIEAQELLRKVASRKNLFLATCGKEELRKFFTSSMSIRNNTLKDRVR